MWHTNITAITISTVLHNKVISFMKFVMILLFYNIISIIISIKLLNT